MSRETDLTQLIRGMQPKLNPSEYVFVSVANPDNIIRADTICEFKEEEGITIVIEKKEGR